MMKLIPMNAPHVIGVRISGKVEKSDVLTVLDAVRAVMAEHDDLHVYVELDEFAGFSWDALWEDLRFALPNLRHFTRKAVVSDKEWVGVLTRIGDKLFPSIEVRHFSTAEKAAARKWIEK